MYNIYCKVDNGILTVSLWLIKVISFVQLVYMYIDYKGLWKLYFAQFIGEWYTLLMLDLFTLKTVIILHVSLHLVLVMILIFFYMHTNYLYI